MSYYVGVTKKHYTIIVMIIVLVAFVQLYKVYNNELHIVFKQMIPTLPEASFTFFSGDKDISNNINFPTNISLKLKAGDTFSGTFIVKNHEKNKNAFELNVDPFQNDSNLDTSINPVMPELKFMHERKFKLEGEDMEIIEYKIDVPEDIKDGRYQTVASVILNKSSSNKNAFMKFNPSIGISLKLDILKNINYHQYEPIITKEPYRIAKIMVISEAKRIATVLLGILSLLFLFKYFRQKSE